MNSKQFLEMVEDIAMQLLQPNLPVVSLKKLKNAVKEAIRERSNSFLKIEEDSIDSQNVVKSIDLEDLRELVYSLISTLQRAVYRENKIALYNRDGIGLNFAQLDGQILEKGDDAFYYSVFTKRDLPLSKAVEQQRKVKSEPSVNGEQIDGDEQDEIRSEQPPLDLLALEQAKTLSSKSSYSANIGDDFIVPDHEGRNELIFGVQESELIKDQRAADALEINQDWREALDLLNEKEEDIYQPFMYRVSNYFKRIILEYGTNRLIFYSLYDKKNIVKSSNTLSSLSMWVLLQALFVSQAENIVFGLIFINFAQSATLINLVLPISALFYALLEQPNPSYRYWRFVSLYVLFAISAKLMIQLPVFCSSPAFGIFNCNEEIKTDQYLVTRIDYIIGLNKFSGPASYPKNIGILPGIIWDMLILIMLVNVKSYLVLTGQWHYVRTDRDIHCMPKFKSRFNEKTEREQEKEAEQKKIWNDQYPLLTFWDKVKFQSKELVTNIWDFFLKIQPRYMDRIQPNRDLRTQKEEPMVVFNPNKVKPGRDYFNGNFFTLMLLFFYTLLFQKSITGAHISEESKAIDFDHFTSSQVILLLSLMLMMMVERMLYRTRKHNS